MVTLVAELIALVFVAILAWYPISMVLDIWNWISGKEEDQ